MSKLDLLANLLVFSGNIEEISHPGGTNKNFFFVGRNCWINLHAMMMKHSQLKKGPARDLSTASNSRRAS